MTDTPAAPEVYTDSAGATHSEHDCRWRSSSIYPGFEACLVNPVAHYREDSAHHTEAFGPSPDTRHLPARSIPAEDLDDVTKRAFVAGLLDELNYDPNEDTAVLTDRVLAALNLSLARLRSPESDR